MKNINESKYNSEILDTIDAVTALFKKLKSDKSINPKITKKLYTDFAPVFKALHQLVD